MWLKCGHMCIGENEGPLVPTAISFAVTNSVRLVKTDVWRCVRCESKRRRPPSRRHDGTRVGRGTLQNVGSSVFHTSDRESNYLDFNRTLFLSISRKFLNFMKVQDDKLEEFPHLMKYFTRLKKRDQVSCRSRTPPVDMANQKLLIMLYNEPISM